MIHSLLTLLVCALVQPASVSPTFIGDDPIIITFPPPPPGPGGNRSIAPISGYIDLGLEAAVLTFSSPSGMVTVCFDNNTSGYSFQGVVNGSGSVVIPLSLSSGFWIVTCIFPDGTVYYGEFEI